MVQGKLKVKREKKTFLHKPIPRMTDLYSALQKENNHSALCERVAGRPTARQVYLARWAFAGGMVRGLGGEGGTIEFEGKGEKPFQNTLVGYLLMMHSCFLESFFKKAFIVTF